MNGKQRELCQGEHGGHQEPVDLKQRKSEVYQ